MLEFADAVINTDDDRLAGARQAVASTLGAEALVDAAAVVGAFNALGLVADSCGVELKEEKEATSTALRRELDVESFRKLARNRS